MRPGGLPSFFTPWSRGSHVSGQAVIEYILMVTVTVIIVGTLVTRLYQPMDRFINGIMGGYVACLLETGELPRLGASDPGSGECRMEPMADGEGSTTADNENKTNPDRDSDSDKAQDPAGQKTASTDRSSGNRGSSSRSSRPRFSLRSPSAGSEGIDGGASRRFEVSLDGGGGGSYFGSGQGSGGYRRRERYVAVTGEWADDMVKKRESRERQTRTAASAGGGGSSQRKGLLKGPPPRDKKLEEMKVSELDLGQIVKIILIAGILIIILVVIGGQALQLSKSWEKKGVE